MATTHEAFATASGTSPLDGVRPSTVPGVRGMAMARILVDACALASAIAVAWALRFGLGVLEVTAEAPIDARAHALAALLWASSVLAVIGSRRLYDEDALASSRMETRGIRGATLGGIAIVSTAVFLLRLFSVSRGWFVLVAVFSYLLLLGERAVVRRVIGKARARGRMRRAVVLVGESPRPFETDEFDVIARLDVAQLEGYLATATERRRRWGVPMPGIVLQAEARPSDDVWDLMVRAGGAGVAVYVVSPVRSVAVDRLTARELDGRTIVKVAPPALVGFRAFEKRAFDIVASAALLGLLAIPMAVIALAVAVTSGPPVLYGQERVGRGGRRFRMWKFRTMVRGAERDSGPVWAVRDDHRRTRIGRSLRTYSLDELPQLWNVLVGDMSIVGPRPERPRFVDSFTATVPTYRHRHRIRPGITGLAQVNGHRGDTALGPRVDADNRYIEHWSLMLDVRITLRTLVEVVRHRNAG